jgi:hypothetical protein
MMNKEWIYACLASMPRQARKDIPGLLQHIIVRGIERGEIFLEGIVF